MKNKILSALLLVCAVAATQTSQAQGFIGNGTGSGIKAVNSSGTLSGVNVGIGVATPAAGTTLEVADPTPGPLGLKLDNLPNSTTPYVLYYDGSADVTYGPVPSGSISSLNYDCGVGTFTVNGVTSAAKAWLLSGATTSGSGDYLGTFNNDDIRIATNNSACGLNMLKQKMIIGSEANLGNISIGWDGVTAPPIASTNSKVLVQNGAVSSTPYAAIGSLPIAASDIGTYIYANHRTSGNNVGVASVADASQPLQVGYIAAVSNGTSSNVGAYLTLSSSTSGADNTGVGVLISGDNGTNEGATISVDGNSSVNHGIDVGVGQASSTTNINTGINANVNGSTNQNIGAAISVGDNTSQGNLGMNINVSGNSTPGNLGVFLNVNGNSNTGQNFGYFASVTGNTAGNYGIITNAYGSTQGNYGIDGTAYGNGTNTHNHGVFGQAYGSGANVMNFGVYGRISANGSNALSTSAGVFGTIDPATNDGNNYFGVDGDLVAVTSPASGVAYYAIYGRQPTPSSSSSNTINTIPTGDLLFGGYFDGDVYASNYYYPSDPKLKNNIEDYHNGIDAIRKLPVKQYTFRTAEYAKMNLPEGRQFGIMATDFKSVFPNFVKTAKHPGYSEGDKEVSFEAVNYGALIPVLVEAVKELDAKTDNPELTKKVAEQQSLIAAQSQQLADQSKQITDLRNMLDDLCTNGCAGFNPRSNVMTSGQGAALYQSIPNPATSTVSIGYAINIPYTSASIRIVTVDDKLLSEYKITGQGTGNISFDTSGMAAGVYKYYLTIDGRIIDSKSMATVSK